MDREFYFPPYSYIKEIWEQHLTERSQRGENPLKLGLQGDRYKQFMDTHRNPTESGIFYPQNSWHIASIITYQGIKFLCRFKDERPQYFTGPENNVINSAFSDGFNIEIEHRDNRIDIKGIYGTVLPRSGYGL